ncbi:MAG: phage portal protein, partial [Parvularcula sp.]|nr:phage portal protein [Parvularcula sp.]
SLSPHDAQLLTSRQFNVEEVCRWFRVPPFMVGHTEKSTSWGTGIEQQMLGFLQFSLRPYLRRIEQAVVKQLLPAAERANMQPKFIVEGLLSVDSLTRATLISTLTQNGTMTRNEARRIENLPPVEGGDELTVQSNLIPLHLLKQIVEKNGPGGSLDAAIEGMIERALEQRYNADAQLKKLAKEGAD